MRDISVLQVKEVLRKAIDDLAIIYPKDVYAALHDAYEKESSAKAKAGLGMLMENAQIAAEQRIPICQDTGMMVIWLHVGQEVHFVDGNLKDAVNEAVAEGYKKNYLRYSVVDDPVFDRHNTGNNTPCILYTDIVEGDKVTFEMTTKGFGSENTSAIKMCKPAEGMYGVMEFVVDTVKKAGPNACPPMVVGVGIGGTFDYAAQLAKRALLRDIGTYNEDENYAEVEKELYKRLNDLKIGALGLHGDTSVLGVMIEKAPTHIAGMPVAVNICCHVNRHAKGEI